MAWHYTEISLFYFGESDGTPLQYLCLENPMVGGAWWATVHGVAKSRTRLSDLTFPFHFHALEKEIVTHSSVLAWRIPGMGEPGELPSMGSHRVGHDWCDLAAAAALFYCPTPNIYMKLISPLELWRIANNSSGPLETINWHRCWCSLKRHW